MIDAIGSTCLLGTAIMTDGQTHESMHVSARGGGGDSFWHKFHSPLTRTPSRCPALTTRGCAVRGGAVAAGAQRVALLGDMLELGDLERDAHRCVPAAHLAGQSPLPCHPVNL